MSLFSFFKTFRLNKPKQVQFAPTEYIPLFWEDDYCQIEVVPIENKAFIEKQAHEIDALASKSKTGYGFSEIFARGPMLTETITKEIRVDYFEKTLQQFQFQKAKHIRYENNQILDCENGKTKAYGFSNFSIFFETKEEFVKTIWIGIGLIVSVPQLYLIRDALYTLGEDCELVLIDWHRLEIFDLAYKTQIEDYLTRHWK